MKLNHLQNRDITNFFHAIYVEGYPRINQNVSQRLVDNGTKPPFKGYDMRDRPERSALPG